MRIVALGLVFGRRFHVFGRMDQMAVGDHRMMGGLLKFPCAVVLRRDPLVLGGMLQQFSGLQVMIDAFLRHVYY